MALHEKIRIKFAVDNRHFEAVGFLKKGESSVNGDEMFWRVPDAIEEEDAKFLGKHVGQDWSSDLWPYYLITNRRLPRYPHRVQGFRRDDGRWIQRWGDIGHQWLGDDLVVRRGT